MAILNSKKTSLKTSLLEVNPKLAKEWHPTKNLPLKPDQIAPKSRKSIWWLCANKQHTWIAPVYSRASGSGCPYCSNRKVNDENKLSTTNPDLLTEWDFKRNNLSPDKVVAGSGKSIFWICRRNSEHIWNATIRNRAINGTGCPYCTNQTSAPELRIYTELKSLFNEVENRKKIGNIEADIFIKEIKLAIEFDGYFYHLGKYKKDKEKNKFFIDQGINILRIRQEPLEKISKNDLIIHKNELVKSDINEVLLKIIEVSNLNKQDFESYLQLENFKDDKAYKKYLSYLPDPFPENSLEVKNKKLSKQWDIEKNYPLTPKNFTDRSSKKIWWKCNYGHSWEATIKDRSRGNGCPKCSGKVPTAINNFQIKYPEKAIYWHNSKNGDLHPQEFLPTSHKTVWWNCLKHKDHEWKQSIANRVKSMSFCPFCDKTLKEPTADYNLKTLYPEIALEFHPTRNKNLTPDKIFPKSDIKIWWKCKVDNSHEWLATPGNRTRNNKKNGCPICQNRLASKDNSISTTHPDLFIFWDEKLNKGIDLKKLTSGSAKVITWKCPKGEDHVWKSAPRNIIASNGCPFCNGRRASKAFNLTTTNEDLEKEWDYDLNLGKLPESFVPGSSYRANWVCKKNKKHKWKAQIYRRAKEGNGCPICNKNKKKLKSK